MCVAEVERSTGYNGGRRNKHKATVFPQERKKKTLLFKCVCEETAQRQTPVRNPLHY